MNQQVVVSIDGGGTYTRAVVAGMDGKIIGFSKKTGSHPGKNRQPGKNVSDAITEAIAVAGCKMDDVAYMAGGFAGVNAPEDQSWANEFLGLPGINCPKAVMNDAELAQFGAFSGGSGIIAVAGTGSIIIGKTENGRIVRNYDFNHKSDAGARYLSYSVIYGLLSEKNDGSDSELTERVLAYWNAASIAKLRLLAARGFGTDKIEAIKRLSEMARIVTDAAEKGSSLAIEACRHASQSLVTGIELVSGMFSARQVPLAVFGGVATNPYIRGLLMEMLNNHRGVKNYVFREPVLSPLSGGILYAYNELGIPNATELKEVLAREEKRLLPY
ncbi:BadF/BadG/BcrA/BcrD ATPase family protein [Bacillus sp. FJAT-27445]|uniref:BadF/BadG/BcrA/BcrD ATPase family protein n=1 Tax=Bacillus sp. FJAT-27445 TaxID=1679166 RepID=UPI000743CDEF|nr:BadF/BadG/BcrA/BcrD ATPase family protein [Bacillus sp. FJAT-27445]